MSQETRADGVSRMRNAVNEPHSRRKFMLLAGGSSVAGVALAACGSDDETTSSTTESDAGGSASDENSLAMFGEGDLGIVNYALTLEYLEAAFYADVIKSGLFKGDDLALIQEIGSNEDEHVAALEATAKMLGDPAPQPETKFDLADADTVLKTAAEVENLGAAAYLGQAANVEDKAILAAALSIHTVEARHAAALNAVLGQTITPDGAFATPALPDEVLPAVQPFIVS
ncbi:MAG: ferritin-like domain-containing protein [Solirubrobacterales bacterium]